MQQRPREPCVDARRERPTVELIAGASRALLSTSERTLVTVESIRNPGLCVAAATDSDASRARVRLCSRHRASAHPQRRWRAARPRPTRTVERAPRPRPTHRRARTARVWLEREPSDAGMRLCGLLLAMTSSGIQGLVRDACKPTLKHTDSVAEAFGLVLADLPPGSDVGASGAALAEADACSRSAGYIGRRVRPMRQAGATVCGLRQTWADGRRVSDAECRRRPARDSDEDDVVDPGARRRTAGGRASARSSRDVPRGDRQAAGGVSAAPADGGHRGPAASHPSAPRAPQQARLEDRALRSHQALRRAHRQARLWRVRDAARVEAGAGHAAARAALDHPRVEGRSRPRPRPRAPPLRRRKRWRRAPVRRHRKRRRPHDRASPGHAFIHRRASAAAGGERFRGLLRRYIACIRLRPNPPQSCRSTLASAMAAAASQRFARSISAIQSPSASSRRPARDAYPSSALESRGGNDEVLR